jgi:hypothetical protein
MKKSAEVAAEAAAAAPADEAPASGAEALEAVFPPALLEYVSTLIARQTREFELRLAEQKEELEATMAEQKEELEATMAEQKEELEAKIEEQKATLDEQGAVLSNLIDPRLSVWNVGGSSSTSSSTPVNVSSSRRAYRNQIGVCMGCGNNSNLSKCILGYRGYQRANHFNGCNHAGLLRCTLNLPKLASQDATVSSLVNTRSCIISWSITYWRWFCKCDGRHPDHRLTFSANWFMAKARGASF